MNTEIPPIDVAGIRRRMSARTEWTSTRLPRTRIAVASAAAVVAGLLLTTASPALMQSIGERYVAALHAAGIGPRIPQPLPQAIRSSTTPVELSLAAAQERAHFALVPPAGLPGDIASRKILAAPLAVWSKRANAWSIDGEQITFAYTRRDGRAFDIIATRFSEQSLPAPRYITNADDVPPDGKPNPKLRRENFIWRNGDQTMRVVTSAAISVREIDRIRASMHGISLPRSERPMRKPAGNRIERFVITH